MNIRLFRWPAACLLILSLSARAEQKADPKPDDNTTAGYHLKNRSSFTGSDAVRPPFFPIGWVKRGSGATPATAAVVQPKLTADGYSLTSVLLGNPAMAVINGRAYAEGETIRGAGRSKDKPAGTAKVRVARIGDGAVLLASGEETVEVRLRRPELKEHKSEEEQLSER